MQLPSDTCGKIAYHTLYHNEENQIPLTMNAGKYDSLLHMKFKTTMYEGETVYQHSCKLLKLTPFKTVASLFATARKPFHSHSSFKFPTPKYGSRDCSCQHLWFKEFNFLHNVSARCAILPHVPKAPPSHLVWLRSW